MRNTLDANLQLALPMTRAATLEREQFERDQRFMKSRLEQIAQEQKTEPVVLQRTYEVVLRRFEPLGIVYLWPET